MGLSTSQGSKSMREAQSTSSQRTPRHLWFIGILALLWGAMGVMDFLMTQTQNEKWLSGFTPEQVEYFLSYPTWLVILWGTSVFAGELGALTLLLRKRSAVPLYFIACIAYVIVTFQNYVMLEGMTMMGSPGELVFGAVIFLVTLTLALYSRSMRTRGVLT